MQARGCGERRCRDRAGGQGYPGSREHPLVSVYRGVAGNNRRNLSGNWLAAPTLRTHPVMKDRVVSEGVQIRHLPGDRGIEFPRRHRRQVESPQDEVLPRHAERGVFLLDPALAKEFLVLQSPLLGRAFGEARNTQPTDHGDAGALDAHRDSDEIRPAHGDPATSRPGKDSSQHVCGAFPDL